MDSTYITVKQAAKQLGVCKERIFALINQDRISGVQRIGNQLAIPKNFTVAPSASGHKFFKISQ